MGPSWGRVLDLSQINKHVSSPLSSSMMQLLFQHQGVLRSVPTAQAVSIPPSCTSDQGPRCLRSAVDHVRCRGGRSSLLGINPLSTPEDHVVLGVNLHLLGKNPLSTIFDQFVLGH